ncbi:MAG: mannose-1-phosphate guanyltransferase [Campylobacteraceae bacterium 4484_4]|nr:MAG: mannose-1-phosphate guanyltransferase [Campylobacteraceae bacterium 4484_4]
MKAVVMAGGFGTRIQPLTHTLPKPMLPIINRPMMEHVIVKLRDDLGITEFVILLYFKPETIRDYFKDGSDWGIKITYVLPDDDYGTAGAVKCAEKYLKDDNFIIVSGDLVTDFDFSEILSAHKKKNAQLTIALTPVEDPLQFGVVITDEEERIEKFLEKPGWGEVFSDTINTGIYIIEPEILEYIPHETNFDFAKDLFPLLMEENITLYGPRITGYWRDVGNPYSYRDVYTDILGGKVNFPFSGYRIAEGVDMLFTQNPENFDHLDYKGVVILGKNVVIGENVRLHNVVIGDNVRIESGTTLHNCVLWNDIKIDKEARLCQAVICDHNYIGPKTHIKQGAIIADNCDILDHVTIEKDVIIWPDKIIEENAIVSNNVVWGSKYKSSIFEEGMVRGRTNIELSCEMSTKLAEALGALLPLGSRVYVSRDYHRSSRMLKRAFLGGLLSSGINVVDITYMPAAAMRYHLAHHEDISAGVHFRQSVTDKTHTEILFFTEEGLRIDTNMAKNIERVFFRENFRRVDPDDIGEIQVAEFLEKEYKEEILKHINLDAIKIGEYKVIVDMMNGSVAKIYPDLLNALQIEHIMLNVNPDEKKLSTLPTLEKKSKENLSKIVRSLAYDLGFIIYPNGQKMILATDEGEILPPHLALLAVLDLVDKTATQKRKVFLPSWAPDIFDEKFENLEIERGKYRNFTAEKLKEYYLVASVEGNFAFTEFALNRDAIFASLKVLEMLSANQLHLGKIVDEIRAVHYIQEQIPCPSSLKGKMMRKFLEDAKGKRASMEDGVKIWFDTHEWILMIPDQYSDNLNLYVQAENETEGEKLLRTYREKIEEWAGEKDDR